MACLRGKILQAIQRWGVPFLLMVVAGRQMILVHTIGLSPWHGGGFGMFASIDRDERRLVKLHTIDCQGRQTIQVLTPEVTGFNEQAWLHLTTAPKASRLRSLGYRLLDLTNTSEPPGSSTFSVCLQQLQIQVWRLHYSQASGQMWYAPVTPAVEVTR